MTRLKKWIHGLSYFILLLIILFGILVAVTRGLSPVLNTHRMEIEQWASEVLQSPVKISDVRISWYLYEPVVTLNRVIILNKSAKQPIFNIKQIKIFFSLWHSLLTWKPVPAAVLIKGSKVTLREGASGAISVQGLD